MSIFDATFRQPVQCKIYVNDTEISSLYSYLREAVVEMTRGSPSMCTLTFDTIRDEKGSWNVQDSGLLQTWWSFQIVADFGSNQVVEIMSGFVKDIHADYPADRGSTVVTVTAQDQSLLLDREHVQKTWSTESNPSTDGDIAKLIAQTDDVDSDDDDDNIEDGLTNASLVSDSTHFQLLKDRAEANGFEFYFRDGELNFRSLDMGREQQKTITVYAGENTNCLSFNAHFDSHLPDIVRVNLTAKDGSQSSSQDLTVDDDILVGDDAITSDNSGLNPFVWVMQPPGATQDEQIARGQAKANECGWKLIAEGELDGALYGAVLVTYETVAVDGVGDTFGGLYYVDHVKHTFNQSGYRQAFKLLKNATGDADTAASGYSALSGGVSGNLSSVFS